jgi:light-regulated signal transduction histidine kinase (bacteriophytochrome)
VPEEKFLNASGRVLTLQTSKVPIVPGNGQPGFLLGVAVEISSRKAAEARILALNEQLKRNSELLESSNQELESFCYSVSHDLRAPLRMITGYSAMLQDELSEDLSDEARRYLRLISEGGLRMAQLIDDLLSFSRLGRKALNRASVEMQALVRRTVHELLAMAEPPHPHIRIEAMPVADGDAALLNQVWVNLIDNAIKYSARAVNPVISISGRIEDGSAVYRVRDNGVGFDMRYYDKLFGVFQRLHGVDEFPGTGVGLAIVQRIVARHGGRAWATSEVGRGADFYFSLPLSAAMQKHDETTLPGMVTLLSGSDIIRPPS